MRQLPPIFREIKNSAAAPHLGAVLRGLKPLCGKFPESEMDLIGWISTRGWSPDERFCADCAGLCRQGLARNPSAARE